MEFLEDEKFDFDLPLSPEDERNVEEEEDDDEIFFGPVGHKERCVATNAATIATKILDDIDTTKALSPLNPEQVVEIFKEATSMAVMLKSCSSEANSDSEDHNRRKDFPELITDISNKKPTHVLNQTQDENVKKIAEFEQTISKNGIESENDGNDGFVVRRRALKERNSIVIDKESSKTQKIKPRSANQKSASRTTKNAATPKRTSFSTSRTERSNKSDSSFGEDKPGKIPVLSQSGLKAPGFSSGHRRCSSSNSSTSSTSPIPCFNETFTISEANGPLKASNIKQPSNQKSKPTTKGMLTKAVTSKPLFAKPNEVHKLQPMKAVQTSARSMSSTGLTCRSSARLKTNARPVSAGSTPLRAQTPRADKTPVKGTTPIRRRSLNVSTLSGTGVKMRPNTFSSAEFKKAVTPRSVTGIPGIAGKGKPGAVMGVMAKRPNNAMKGTLNNPKEQFGIPKLHSTRTPENKKAKNAKNTPDRMELTPEHKPKPASACKRRSLLPTPNIKKTERKTEKPSSPVSMNPSPDVSKTIERAKKIIWKLDIDQASPKIAAASLNSKISSPKKPNNKSEEVKPDSKCPEMAATTDDGPDLMIQVSPVVPEAKLVTLLDPFSPGIESPNIASEVLNPIVVSSDSKDLIDLSYQSPKPEVDLIDLAAKSPLVEAKLVDI